MSKKSQTISVKTEFMPYFLMHIGMGILAIPSLGLSMIYLSYWRQKYFFDNLEINE